MICSENRRCKKHLFCRHCAGVWQKNNFKNFSNTLKINSNDSLTYLVIKSKSINNLSGGLRDCYGVIEGLRELKKNDKIDDFYLRLEISFSNDELGFNPHLNILAFGNINLIEDLAKTYDLTVWKQSKKNDKNTALSVVWYMLKYNHVGEDKAKVIQYILKKRRTILMSQRFTIINKDKNNIFDEVANMDFSFLGIKPIRSKEEVALRIYLKEERKKLNLMLKNLLKKEEAN